MLALLMVPVIFAGFVLAFFGQGMVCSMLPTSKVEMEVVYYLTIGDKEKAENLAQESKAAFLKRWQISYWIALVAGISIMVAAAEIGFGHR